MLAAAITTAAASGTPQPLSASLPENSPAGASLGTPMETTAPAGTVSYSLSGTDAGLFNIDPESGEITLAQGASPDFETRAGYSVTITAAANLAVSVDNIDEPGGVSLSTNSPRSGEALSASLTDPDGSVSTLSWRWQRSTEDGGWEDIPGATNPDYTPGAGDIGRRLQAVANYDDGSGQGRTAQTATGEPVRNDPPEFSADTASRNVDENTDPGATVGDPITATDPNGDDITYSLTGSGEFTIDPQTGQLSVAEGTTLDHEATGTHSLTLQARDIHGDQDEIAVTVSVNNLDEARTLTLSHGALRAGSALTASIEDPDGSISNQNWQWRRDGQDIQGANSGSHTATYTDNTVEPNKQYVYRIKAINQHGISERSSWVRAYTPADPALLAPSNLAAELTDGGVALRWQAPAEEDGPVTGYEILRAQGQDEPTTLVADTGTTATTHTDQTATGASTIYIYRVRAIRDSERSQDSNQVRVQLPPAKPTGLSAEASHNQVTLTWADPQDNTITGYRILRQEPAPDDSGQFAVLTEDTGQAETSYTDDTVEPERAYMYRVLAINPVGVSESSRDIQASTHQATVSEPRNGDFPTRPVTRGYIAIGESATGSIRPRGDGDAFRVELESGITYQIDVKGDATADGTLTDPRTPGIKDADGEIIPGTSNDNSNNTLNSQIRFTPTQSGSHYIVVRSAVEDHGPHSTGTYTVSIKLEGAAEEEQTDLVAADSSTRAFLGVDGEFEETIDHFADEDWFRVILTTGTRYVITVTGSLADDSLTLEIPWLFGLLDSESQPLLMHQRDDEEAESTRIQAVDGVAAGYHRAENDGTYYVSVSSHSDIGTYRVSLKEAPDSAQHNNGIPDSPGNHFHALGPYSPQKNFNAWCPNNMEQKTVGDTPVEGGTHITKFSSTGEVGVMSDGSTVPLNTLTRCIGAGDPYIQKGVPLIGENGNILYSNTNRRWYRIFDHGSASNSVPNLGALSDANPVITRPDYLRYTEEQDWSRFSVSKPGTFCASVDQPAVTVKRKNGGDAQSIHGAARVYRERVSRTPMSLDFANDPDGAKAAWLANSEIVRVELPSGSSARTFYSDGTELPLKDVWYLHDGTIDGDDYGGIVGDQRNVISYGRKNAKPMADRLFQSHRHI